MLAIADTCVDLIVDMGEVTPRFGQVEQWVPDYHLEMGGSNCIFACQAARLGLRTALLGYVGDDAYGQLVLRRLRESGVDTRYIQGTSELKTGLGIALNRGGDRAILTCAGTLSAVRPADVTDPKHSPTPRSRFSDCWATVSAMRSLRRWVRCSPVLSRPMGSRA